MSRRADRRIVHFSGRESLEWRASVDGWLAGVGQRVPGYRVGLIGFEVDDVVAEPLAAREERAVGYLLPGSGYFPANR